MRGSVPENTAVVLAPLAAPTAASGIAGASAPMTTSTMRWQVLARAATAAGNFALSSEPVGADDIEHDPSRPWLFGTSGSSSAFSA